MKIPHGYALVPLEPFSSQLRAGFEALVNSKYSDYRDEIERVTSVDAMAEVYRAMLVSPVGESLRASR